LYNSMGQISARGIIQNTTQEISLGNLPEGLYFLQTPGSLSKVQISY